jgi:ATP-dependent helicase YprA (DUF1998 family)
MLRVHVEEAASAELSAGLDAIVAEGARRMLAAALEAEVDAYVSSLTDERDEQGIAWWCATGTPKSDRWSPGREVSRCGRQGSMTAGSMT